MWQYSRETLISLLLQHPSARYLYWRIDQFQRQRHIQAVVVLAMLSLSGIHVQIACAEVPKPSLKRDSYWINPKYFKTKTICKTSRTTHAASSTSGPSLQAWSRCFLSFRRRFLFSLIFFLTYLLAASLFVSSFPASLLLLLLACWLASLLALPCFFAGLLACSRGAPNWKNIPAQKTGKHFSEKYTGKTSTNLFDRIGWKKVSRL